MILGILFIGSGILVILLTIFWYSYITSVDVMHDFDQIEKEQEERFHGK